MMVATFPMERLIENILYILSRWQVKSEEEKMGHTQKLAINKKFIIFVLSSHETW